MRVEVLYFDGCPKYVAATRTLQVVLSELGMEAKVELVAVNSDEEAQRLRFPGSPTIRADGRDLFPTPEREDWRVGCRFYATPEGLLGTPTVQMLKATLHEIGQQRTAGLETPVRVRHIHQPGDEAVGEEAGWMGYVVDPMQDRWSALTTGIVLGAVWGVFHAIPDIQANHGPAWIAWQHGVYAVALRILIVSLYNNTAKSVFAAVIVHDTDNVSWSLFPNFGSHYDPPVTGAIAAVAATTVTFLWSAKTLARYRYAGSR